MEQKKSLMECFVGIYDPRVKGRCSHQLIDIMVITICAVLCGAEGWDEIEEFGLSREEWFKGFLELPNGIPSHDTIARVFAIIDPKAVTESFIEWVKGKVSEGRKVIAIDGKTARGSRDESKGKKAIHMVQAIATEEGIILGQEATKEKSNEITAIPKLLEKLEVKGCVITIDAMGCQKKIVEKIIKKKADYVLALKDNQKELSQAVQLFLDEQIEKGFTNAEYDYYETKEKGHGRKEARRYWVTGSIGWLKEQKEWHGIKSIGVVESERTVKGKTSTERRYYITSLDVDAEDFAKAVRNHWKVESSHWMLDVGFREDESRKRNKNCAKNFAIIRRLALNILRLEKTSKRGIKGKRLKAGWDTEYLFKLLKLF